MKYLSAILFFVSSYSFAQLPGNNMAPGSTYFSYLSLCNMSFKFKGNNLVSVNNNGKKFDALIVKSKFDSGYYDVNCHEKFLWTFQFFDGDIIIANQHYESPCEVGKGIFLQKIKKVSDSSLLEFLTDYTYATYETDAMNNKAFYLMDLKDQRAAILLLNKIIEAKPDRVVAYLNIADCYWELKDKSKAVDNYKKYYNLMQEQHKDMNRIPKYVVERIQ